jgi:hypothetical protein
MNRYIGRDDILSALKSGFEQVQASNRFNIVGGEGLGRTSLLNYLYHALLRDNKNNTAFRKAPDDPWTWSIPFKPIVIFISSEGFSSLDSFIMLLHSHLKHYVEQNPHHMLHDFVWQFSGEAFAEADDLERLAYETHINLKSMTRQYNVIILIDDFHRIFERMSEYEISHLQMLYPLHTHYVLVTDYRSCFEINWKRATSSDFFTGMTVLAMTCFSRDERCDFIKYLNERDYNRALSNEEVDLIIKLAGGNPSLITAVLKKLHTSAPKASIDPQIQEVFLRHLLDDHNVMQPTIRKLKVAITSLSPHLQEFLLYLATGWADKKRDLWLPLVSSEDIAELLKRGLLSPERVEPPYELDSVIVQYLVVTTIHRLQLSPSEAVLFDALYAERRLFAIAEIENLFGQANVAEIFETRYKGDDVSKERRRFLDSTLARLRRKIKEQPNRATLFITQGANGGYMLVSLVRLDILMKYGEKTFDLNEGELEKKLT